MTVYILGGGPAGLAIAHGLTEESDIAFVVLERGPSLGGLAQTLKWGEHGLHDLGPHKIFTLDKALMARVEGLLPQERWLTRPKKSSIYMEGHFLQYPPSPFSLIKIYGLFMFIRMVLDYGIARIRSLFWNKVPSTFEEDIENRVGRKLYEALFKPIALKLWGNPNHLDVKLSQGRVQTPSLAEVIGRLLKFRVSSDFEALDFRYPKGGLQQIWEALFRKTRHQGAYNLNQEVLSLVVENKNVSMIRYRDRVTGEEKEIKIQKDDFIFSTLPLGLLGDLMHDAIAPGIVDTIKKIIQLNDLLLVFLKVDPPSLLNESWVFIPDPAIVFHRLSEQESFDPDMTPGGSIVCCEIMNNEIRPMSRCSDSDLITASKKGLVDMGYKDFSVLDQRVIRLPSSYPVFRPGFESALYQILGELDRFKNFRTIGRQGAFNYIGTLDAMDIGYGAARWFIRRQKENWKEERKRTSHYPVLD
jgi:protoporphyrinogen oxidase